LGRFHVELEDRLTRGEIWTASDDAEYAGKPRPVVIIQHKNFEVLDSVTICGFTSDPTVMPFIRIPVTPSALNGLEFISRIMVDKILTIRKSKLGYRIGRLANEDMARLDDAIVTFLGLAD
jgi:mRNA interferase MazF